MNSILRCLNQLRQPAPRRQRPWFAPTEALEMRLLPSGLSLVNDTGTAGDNITTDPTITGPTDVGELLIDVNGDGVEDLSASPDANGNLLIDLSQHVTFGEVTVTAWTMTWDDSIEDYVINDVGSLTFEYEYIPPNEPPEITLGVVQGLANLWTFSGTVTDENPEGLTVTFGGILQGYTAIVRADGTYSLTVQLPDGTEGYVSAQTVDDEGEASDLAEDYLYSGEY